MSTIIFGTVWAMGFVGFIGMGMSSQTSGVLSMIMGIGIDFGIQVVTRYRFEMANIPGLKESHPNIDLGPKDAMAVTLNNVIVPMLTTTLAALIGFRGDVSREINVPRGYGNDHELWSCSKHGCGYNNSSGSYYNI